MSYREQIYRLNDNSPVSMYTSVTVAQNEPMFNEVMNRSIGELNLNDMQLEKLNKLIFSQLNISEYVKGNKYNAGDLVWYKDSEKRTFLLRCIKQENTDEPNTSAIEDEYTKYGNDVLLRSGWENQNRHLTILDYDVMNLVREDALNSVISHEDNPSMHPFGRLDVDLDEKFLKSDLSNINPHRKSVFFPAQVKRLESGTVTITGYQRDFGSVVEYDIILKLASSKAVSFRDLFSDVEPLSANNVSFEMFSGISQSGLQFQMNKNYFVNPADMDIFQPEGNGASRCGIIAQRQRNDFVNTYSAKITFDTPFKDLNYMVFSNSILSQTIGSHTMVPSANDITYCDKTRQSITFINITFPDSTKYGDQGYNSKNGGLVSNSFHIKVIGQKIG